MPNFEELDLGGCTRLREIHPTLLLHKKIILLNLKDCKSLTTLPDKICMESLKILVLSGCRKFKNFREIVGSRKCLSELLLDGTDIKELPKHKRSKISSNFESFWPFQFSEFSEIMTSMEHLLELHLEGTAIRGLPVSIEHLTGLVLLNLRDCKNLETLPSTIDGLKSLRNLYLSGCSKLKSMPGNFGKVESLEVLDLSGCKGPPLSSSWYLPFLISLMRRCSDPMALGFPSLSGLCSLRKLDLSDSNLGEGAIPNDIGNLCSLKELYLSKNSFITLPASINRLFNLEKLELEDCKRLQSMPQLPPSIEEVRVNGCASLETLSGALKLCNSEYISINCIDDLKLLGCNGFAFSMLKEYLEVMSNPKQKFDIVVPGSEIPEWFMHQNDGSSIKFIMPSNLYCKNKALGYAVCCVFHVHNHSPGLEVKRCGFHPVYRHNVEFFNQPRNQWTRYTTYNLNEFYPNFVVTKMAVATTSN
ncbi:hypothetical protein CISIN_1g036075mg [Citrus sinensis]|uniref:Uncharacterized protein n=1 Tax=Citrus sinensis TaxID=2711 RepID=A0A067D5I6_CITSI|nr:hypothetical protein CISIN_1g036075mg [Citrus sinensis]